MIPASFDYEVAESVERAIELLVGIQSGVFRRSQVDVLAGNYRDSVLDGLRSRQDLVILHRQATDPLQRAAIAIALADLPDEPACRCSLLLGGASL
mgnify:CR=1 FL=1